MNFSLVNSLELVAAAGATLIAVAGAAFLSLRLKLTDTLDPGNIVIHTQDASEDWWRVDYVWWFGVRLVGNNGTVKYMRVCDAPTPTLAGMV